jgi:hypothetical protein
MAMRSSISRTARLVGVIVGGVLVMLAVVVRIAAPEPEFLLDDELRERRADGTVVIYDYVDNVSGESGQSYEIVAIDASTSVVYAVDDNVGVRAEVFRGSHSEAESVYGAEDVAFGFDFVPVDADTEVAYLMDEERGVRVEVYRGGDGWEWFHDQVLVVVFEGTEAEAEAWIDSQPVPRREMMIPNAILIAGAVTILAGLSLSSPRAPKRPLHALIGAAAGSLPGVVVLVIVESPLVEGEASLSYGVFGLMIAFIGLIGGAAIGASIADRGSELPRPAVKV